MDDLTYMHVRSLCICPLVRHCLPLCLRGYQFMEVRPPATDDVQVDMCPNGVSLWRREFHPDAVSFINDDSTPVKVLARSTGLQSTKTSLLTLLPERWLSQDILYDMAVICRQSRPESSTILPLPTYFYQKTEHVLSFSARMVAKDVERLRERDGIDVDLYCYVTEELKLPPDTVGRLVCMDSYLRKSFDVTGTLLDDVYVTSLQCSP